MLLDEYGIDHDAKHPGLDDSDLHPGAVSAGQWVAALAYLKSAAGAVEARVDGCTMVLGADTAIVKDGELIGTPRDAAEAERIIRRLADGAHEVVTGVSILCAATGRRTVYFDRAKVRVGALSERQITEYIASGGWEGKAGAYNLRERIEAGWPIQFDGDPTTIMGLPMGTLRGRLDRFAAGARREGDAA